MEQLRQDIMSKFEPFIIDLFESEFQVLKRQIYQQTADQQLMQQQPEIFPQTQVKDVSSTLYSINTIIDISSDNTAEIISDNYQNLDQTSYSMLYSSFFDCFQDYGINIVQDINKKTHISCQVVPNKLPVDIQQSILTDAYLSPRKKNPTQYNVKELKVQEKLIQEKLSLIGIQALRKEQQIVMDQILQRQNLIVCLPTSGGKSLLYMLPALVFNKVVIVITPTIALRQDQVQHLQKLNINAYQLIKGSDITEISPKQLESIGDAAIVFVTPEKMVQESVQQTVLRLIQKDMLALIAIDECHLMLDWSAFRDSYTQIPSNLGVIKKGTASQMPAMLCLSATLNDLDIYQLKCSFMEHDFAFKEICFSPFRQNLYLRVIVHSANNDEKFRAALLCLGNTDQAPQAPELKTIIYARSKDKNDQIQQALEQVGYACNKYHNGINAKQRQAEMNQFKINPNGIITCTISFGMGINITDVRQVINFDLPGSINEMLQKVGRAGRNGQQSIGTQLFSTKDIKFVYKLVVQDPKETMKSKKVMQLIEVYQLFNRQICIWAQLQKYYYGYDIKECYNNCCFCKLRKKRIVFVINIRNIVEFIYNSVKSPIHYSMLVDAVLNQHDPNAILSQNYEIKYLTIKYGTQWKVPLIQYIINEMVLHNQLGITDDGLIISKLLQPEKCFMAMVTYSNS